MKQLFKVAIFILAIIPLASCENKLVNDKENYQTITLTHTVSKFDKMDGENEIYKRVEVSEEFYINPKKVITFSLGVADTFNYLGLNTLGIEVFGLPKDGQPLPEMLKNFNDKKYYDVGTLFEPDFNIIELINPDLIILDGRSAKHYTKIKEKYPYINVLDASLTTYNVDDQEKVFENLGKIFPIIKAGLEELVITFKEKFIEISNETNKYRAMFLQLNGDNLSVGIGKNGRYGLLFNEFGFNESDPNGNKLIENSHGASSIDSIEYINEVNPDVIFLMDRNIITESHSSDETFLKEAALKNVNAIKNNYVYHLQPEAWYTITGGANTTLIMINDIMNFIIDVYN